jgi:hypothetical protein
MIDESVRILKAEVVARWRYCHGVNLEGLKKITENRKIYNVPA